ncbi:MAG TPA: nicotinate-nucleotide adenylyltransferase [Ktedonobacterales bacterium]|nr:nicotinate-nucleotide adenylyltransferase [Ktedonobacterales bacterium]
MSDTLSTGTEPGARTGPRYGIFGGTFDPPHIGHLVLAQETLVHLNLERVWFVPTGTPPHKPDRPISPQDDRRAMVERAIAGNERFALSAIELARGGPSYSVDTLDQMRREWGVDVYMCLIMGWDMLAYLPHWREPERVLATVDCVAAVRRPGVSSAPDEMERLARALPGLSAKLTVVPAPLMEVSASDIRRRVASDVPIRYLVPDPVRSYIERRGLYRAPAPNATGGPT